MKNASLGTTAGTSITGAALAAAFALLLATAGCESRDKPGGLTGPGGPVGGGASGGSGGSGGTNGGGCDPGVGTHPDTRFLPTPSADCPPFFNGAVPFEFTASGAGGGGGGLLTSRQVEIRMSTTAPQGDGPLVVVWHAQSQDPVEGLNTLGEDVILAILDAGGIVAAPYADPSAGAGMFPWFYCLGDEDQPDDDLRLMDQIVACTIEEVGIDDRRIHMVGFAEGAMQVAQAAMRRSGYIASVVVHSTALAGTPPEQLPSNKYAAMILHGGADDQGLVEFGLESDKYYLAITGADDPSDLFASEHFAFVCPHGFGHQVAVEALEASWQFLQDHPYGADPSPYECDGLPALFPDYCDLDYEP